MHFTVRVDIRTCMKWPKAIFPITTLHFLSTFVRLGLGEIRRTDETKRGTLEVRAMPILSHRRHPDSQVYRFGAKTAPSMPKAVAAAAPCSQIGARPYQLPCCETSAKVKFATNHARRGILRGLRPLSCDAIGPSRHCKSAKPPCCMLRLTGPGTMIYPGSCLLVSNSLRFSNSEVCAASGMQTQPTVGLSTRTRSLTSGPSGVSPPLLVYLISTSTI